MTYKVHLIYFRPTGKYLAHAETLIDHDAVEKIWAEIDEMRRLGRLPGLRPNAGRDLFIVVDVPDHPQQLGLHLVLPPFIDEDDITPPRISTGEMVPLVRVPLEEIPRTTTRDVIKVDPEREAREAQEVTPVDPPALPPPDEET